MSETSTPRETARSYSRIGRRSRAETLGRTGRVANGPGDTEHRLVLVSIGGVDSQQQSVMYEFNSLERKAGLLNIQGAAGGHDSCGDVHATARRSGAGNENWQRFM